MICNKSELNSLSNGDEESKGEVLTAGPGLPSRPSLPGAPVNPCKVEINKN